MSQKNEDEHLAVFALGFCVGALFICLPAIFLDADSKTYTFIEKFQTLIGGLLAFIGAAWTFYYLRRQERLTHSQLTWLQGKDEKVARATLALSLNEITEYAARCMHVAQAYHVLITSHAAPTTDPGQDAPTISAATITNLSQAAASLNAASGSQVADLLNFYQVQHARLTGLVEDYRNPTRGIVMKIVTPLTAEGAMHDAARLHLLTDALYSEARTGTNFRPPFSRDVIEQRLRMVLGLP